MEVALLTPSTAEDHRQALESVLEELQHLTRLADKLLFLAKVDGGEITLAARECSLAAHVLKVLELWQPAAQAQGLRLLREGDARAWVDPDLFEQAVANLVSNSVRAAPGGWVRVHLEETPHQALVRVIDNGCGMDPSLLSGLTQRFSPLRVSSPDGHG